MLIYDIFSYGQLSKHAKGEYRLNGINQKISIQWRTDHS